MDGVDRLARRGDGVDDVAEQLHVGELQVGGIGQVDVGVAQVVEDERAPAGPFRVDAHIGAVVGGLHIARPAGRDGDTGRGDGEEHTGADHACGQTAAEVEPQRRAGRDQQ